MTNSYNLLLIESSKYLLFGVYFSLHQGNTTTNSKGNYPNYKNSKGNQSSKRYK